MLVRLRPLADHRPVKARIGTRREEISRRAGRQLRSSTVSATVLAAAAAAITLGAAWCLGGEAGVRFVGDISYRDQTDEDPYARQRCKLDLYLPTEKQKFSCLVWFHGGGLETGSRAGEKPWGRSLALAGVGLAAVDYRLSPQAKFPAYIEDAAAAVAWVRKNIARYGGDPAKIFVGGHSAGGYLTAMVVLDKGRLAAFGEDANALAGAIPVSGQMITHSTVRKERGIPRSTEIVDHAAPLSYARADAPPMLLMTADGDMVGRSEENRPCTKHWSRRGTRQPNSSSFLAAIMAPSRLGCSMPTIRPARRYCGSSKSTRAIKRRETRAVDRRLGREHGR